MGSNPIQLVALAAAAMVAVLGLVLLIRRHPRWGMALWTLAFFFTPIWLGAGAMGVFVSALTAMTVIAIISGFSPNLRWSNVDTVMAVLLLVILLAYAVGGSIQGHVQDSVVMWFLPYVWGRMVLARVTEDWVAACIATAAVGASLLGLLEFVTSQNLFLLTPGASSSTWGNLQERGGLLRVEGAFGHSIALGGALAISAAFLLTVRWRPWLRATALVVVGAATVVTFSRLGIIGFALTLVLGVIFLGAYVGRGLRIAVLSILLVGAAAVVPTILDVFGEAGSEAEGSANYRVDLLGLTNSMVLLGVSPEREVLPTGEDYWAGFRSIDSALILIGLRFGLLPLGVVLVLLAILIGSVVIGRATPASVALVAQIPAFATVALITQYAAFVWFAAGLAVSAYALRYGRDADQLAAAVARTAPPPGMRGDRLTAGMAR
ncbi:hypothetical protein [Microbacterium sp. SSM24]|uniref:hypothetical protein n=1 Tax=Microbacterium sp. SSM24 TaxID=2991714 RepID=UPI002226EF86|nr:hypothetical protein [Microbacterium sp. SSM24]MCW3492770.1 hypothetical protein [Microbacterium sp. SSM24]